MLQRQSQQPAQGQSGHGKDSQPPAVAVSHHSVAGSSAPRKIKNWSNALWYQRVTAFRGRFSSQQENLSIKNHSAQTSEEGGVQSKDILKDVFFWNISSQTTVSVFWAALLRCSKGSCSLFPSPRQMYCSVSPCTQGSQQGRKEEQHPPEDHCSEQNLAAYWLSSTSKDCSDKEPPDFIQLSPGLLLTAAGKQHKLLCTF